MEFPNLPYPFKNLKLLEEAFTHPSLIPLQKNQPFHYERLEFLGDAVLNTCLSHRLFQLFPEASEGTLAKAKNVLAKGPILAQIAKILNLSQYIQLSPGERTQHTHEKPSVLASVWESIIAVAFLEGGLSAAEILINYGYNSLHPNGLNHDWITQLIAGDNPKGHLQEYLQAHTPDTQIIYNVTQSIGPDHAKAYTVTVSTNHHKHPLGTGQGPSKKIAEEHAAKNALISLKVK